MIRCVEFLCMDKKVGGAYQFFGNLKSASDLHDHDFYEFFLITNGSVVHHVNGQTETLSEGMLVFVRPTDCHGYDKNSKTECQFINIVFSVNTMKKILSFFDNDNAFDSLLSAPNPTNIKLLVGEKKMLQEKLEELNVIQQADKKLLKMKLRAILIEIFTKYFINLQLKKIHNNAPHWLENLYNEMQKPDNFRDGLTNMEKISKRSREHISRSFIKCFNITPAKYINDLRINYAANLLCNSDMEIIDICYDCGFQNLSHFYHLFKEKHNLSPAKFRKQNGHMF